MISQIIDQQHKGIARHERTLLIKEVLDEALGLGALEDLLANDNISEIMVNGHHQIFVENKGRLSLSKVTFTSNFHLRKVIERIVTPLGRRIDETSPYVDARLKDGSRVNAVIEPIAIDGPSITIRKFSKSPFTIQNYLEYKSITQPMINFLKICVENGMNDLIIGQQAQNTLEHAMKALLEAHRVSYQRTHNIGHLLGRIRRTGPQLLEFAISIAPDIYTKYAGEQAYELSDPLLTDQPDYRQRTVADARRIIHRAREVRQARTD